MRLVNRHYYVRTSEKLHQSVYFFFFFLCFRFFKSWMTIRLHWRLPDQRNTAIGVVQKPILLLFPVSVNNWINWCWSARPGTGTSTQFVVKASPWDTTPQPDVCEILWKYETRGQVLFFRILTAAMSRPMINDIWQSLGLGHVNIN